MILEISNGTATIDVEISSNGGSRKILLAGTEVECDCVRLAEGHYSLILNGRVLDVLVNVDPETCVVTSQAGTYSFRVKDPRRSASRQKAEAAKRYKRNEIVRAHVVLVRMGLIGTRVGLRT